MYLSALGPHQVKSCCHETDFLRSSTQDLGQYLISRKEWLFKISIVRGLGNWRWSLQFNQNKQLLNVFILHYKAFIVRYDSVGIASDVQPKVVEFESLCIHRPS
jgi:hypothetical protein